MTGFCCPKDEMDKEVRGMADVCWRVRWWVAMEYILILEDAILELRVQERKEQRNWKTCTRQLNFPFFSFTMSDTRFQVDPFKICFIDEI